MTFWHRAAAALCAALCVGLPARAARAEPALWRIDSSTAHIYLFGTMHILGKNAAWFGPKITSAFNASGAVWEEADIGSMDPQAMSQIMAQAVAPDFDLWQALSGDYERKLRGELHGCGLDGSMMTHMKPWMASMMVTVCGIMSSQSGGMGAAADNPETVLRTRAQADGKSLHYFETVMQQVNAMAQAPQSTQIAELRQSIDEAAAGKNQFGQLQEDWLNGNVASIAKTVADTRKEDEAFYQTIFVQRNARFAATIGNMLQGTGTVFVAIGAGHFAGEDSVLRMLADHGIKAVRQ
jgi:uncharacterized protein YbaP (TraB family)